MATKLPLPGCKSLAKSWQKFVHIMRWGRVSCELERHPVQKIVVQFEPDIWKQLDKEQQDELTALCTDGAPSCTMRLKTAEGKEVSRSGPLFQLQVVVQNAPGRGAQQELRNVCFSEGVALLEKQLPRESRVVENSRFLACSRRYVKFQDIDGHADQLLASLSEAPQPVHANKAVKASSFCWQGRGTVDAAPEAAAIRDVRGLSLPDAPGAFKWCNPRKTTQNTNEPHNNS